MKWRTSSDPTNTKLRKLQGRLRMCQKYDKTEVPDIIEGVPVCSNDIKQDKTFAETDPGRVVFHIPDDSDRQRFVT